jgi:diguanylate cyclase
MLSLTDLSLQILLLDLMLAVFMLAMGGAAGWLLSPRGPKNKQSDNAEQAIEKLRELASTVAADVGHHASRMQAINTEFSEAQAQGNATEGTVSQTLADILKANEALQEKLSTAEVRLQRQEEELKSHLAEARTDALTGVCNRRAFDDELSRRIAEWQRRRTMFSLVMLDVDFFKKFNDKYGHQAGDEVLKGVAKSLKDTMREMDFVARYGGEEFAAVLPVTSQREALIAAERIRDAIESAVNYHDGTELRVTCSIGVAQVLGNNTAAEVIKRADAALYHSKSAGRNCVHFHNGEACRPAAEGLGELALDPQPELQPDPQSELQPEPQQTEEPATLPMSAKSEEYETGFHADLRRRVAEARRFHVPLSLMMIEIDGFSDLSEKFGMAISDLVYDTMGDFLRVVMQEMDVASRRGNGQFAIMMPGTDLESAVTVAERLRSAVEGHTLQVKGVQLRLTLSAGLAETMDNDDSSTLTKRAVAALFAARNGGCNCTFAHNGEKCEAASVALVSC